MVITDAEPDSARSSRPRQRAEKINEFLRRPRPAANAAGARNRRGDLGWTAAGKAAAQGSAKAVSSGLVGTAGAHVRSQLTDCGFPAAGQ